MNIIAQKIQWIMLISGILTCTMIYAAIAPESALMLTFGESIRGPLAEIIVRNWGALITLVGATLIYGAFQPQYRSLILVIAAVSKAIFIGLVLTIGPQYLGKAGGVIGFDTLVVLLFSVYLITSKRTIHQP